MVDNLLLVEVAFVGIRKGQRIADNLLLVVEASADSPFLLPVVVARSLLAGLVAGRSLPAAVAVEVAVEVAGFLLMMVAAVGPAFLLYFVDFVVDQSW